MNLATTTERTFDRTATEMFAVLVNPTTYPRWLVGAKKIRSVSPDWPARGSYFKHTVGFGLFEISDRTTLREIDAPRALELLVRARPAVEANVSFRVTSQGLTSCTVCMTETPVGIYKLIAPLARPMIRARNDRSMERLQHLVAEAPNPMAAQ